MTCKKDNNLIIAMFDKWTKLHFIPFLILDIQYMLMTGEPIYHNGNSYYYRGSIFTLIHSIFNVIALVFLIYIYAIIRLPCQWYFVLTIKKGTFSTLIFMSWISFYFDIFKYLTGEPISLLVIFLILIGLGAIIFSICFVDLTIIFLNLIYFLRFLANFSAKFKEYKYYFRGIATGTEIVLVFMTHSDRIPPASTFALIPFLLEPCIIPLLITFAMTINGTKQKSIKVKRYS